MNLKFQVKCITLLGCLSMGMFPLPALSGVTMSKSSFIYLGAFRVPKGSVDGKSVQNNPSVNAQYQPLAYNPANNSLFIGQSTGTETEPKGVAEITIPDVLLPSAVDYDVNKLNESSFIQLPTDVSQGGFDGLLEGGGAPSDEAKGHLGGLFVYGGRLLGTVWSYYDASGSNSFRSHWTANIDWTGENYGFDGLHAVGRSPVGSVANGGFVGGYIAEIPGQYKDILGYDLLTGRSGGPIAWRASFGPTLWGYSHDQLNFDQPAGAEMFLGYTSEHQTIGGYGDIPSLTHNMSTGIKGVVWPKESSTIFFFGGHGFGIAYNQEGVPLNNPAPHCSGPGTSNRGEVKSNDWLVKFSSRGWACGYNKLTKDEIARGSSCCFDPSDPSVSEHFVPYVIGSGESCYGPGTNDHTIARTNSWLVTNSSAGYNCGDSNMSESEIVSGGSSCCFVGSGETSKGGGHSQVFIRFGNTKWRI